MTHVNIVTGLPCECGFGERKLLRQWPRTASWEPGRWGKGLYFPENDHLVTWSDERDHPTVRHDDENAYIPGVAAELTIMPDGTARASGEPPEGLEGALRREGLRFDPDLFKFVDQTPTSPEYEDKEGRHPAQSPQISNEWDGFPG